MRKLLGFSLVVITLLIGIPDFLIADPLDNWHLRNPLPQGNNLSGVAYGNGTFVAVGDSGTILTSPDGVTWTIRTSGTDSDLFAATYANGIFVVVGGSTSSPSTGGTILTSPDGVTWTIRISGANGLSGVTYGNSTFVAVGWSGTILTSPDGVTWITRSSGTNSHLSGVTYGNGTFVALGELSILTSPDGVTWTTRTLGTNYDLSGVTYGNGTFVAVGGIIFTSPDGVTWTTRSSGTYCDASGVTYGNGTFVAVGYETIATSPGGLTWVIRTPGIDSSPSGLTYGNGTFVAVGGGTILTSPDGVTWTTRTSGTNYYLSGATYGNGTFVAVGGNTFYPSNSGTILTSPDGVAWTIRISGTTGFSGVAYGNGTFVGVGSSGTIVTSPDGVTWTTRTSGTNSNLSGLTYGNGTFVAVGWSGTILTSPDGVTWITRSSGTNSHLSGVTYGNGTFVAVGNHGTILQSDPVISIPGISVNPTSFNFGDLNVASTSDKQVTVRNDGNANLIIGTITSPSLPFSKIADNCSGQTFAPAASCIVTYRFSPTSEGSFSSNSNIPSNDPDESTVTVSLNGIGVAETITTPSILTGPITGTTGTSYSYTTGGSTSSLGHSLEYQFDWKGDGTDLSPWGSATQSKTWTSAGTYNVKARARCTVDTSVVSGWSSALSVTISSAGPAVRHLPGCYTPSAPVTVTIDVTPSATTSNYGVVETVPNGWTVSDINENGWWDNEFSNCVRWFFPDRNNRTLTYKATSPSGETGTETFSGTVVFDEDVVTISGDSSIGRCPSETISTPTVLSGPTSGTTGASYNYSTGGSSSNLGHSIQYFFDWGDGTNSGWLPVGTTSASKSWASAGTYLVKAQARCATDTSMLSSWSSSISVNIGAPVTYTLTTNVSPIGSGTVTLNPAGGMYNAGTVVTLTATANSGYSFSSWSGDLTGSTNPTSITMNSNKSVTANFNQVNYTLSLSKSGNGSVRVNGTLQSLPWSGTFSSGSVVQLEAVPDTGWNFSNWSGDLSGSTNPTSIAMNGNKSVTANFSQLNFVTEPDSVTVPEGGTATFQVKLSAQPSSTVFASVSRFSGDTDITVQSGSSLTFTTSNWSTYQTVTLSAAEDADTTNGTATIRISASGLPNKDITAVESDNDVSPPYYTMNSNASYSYVYGNNQITSWQGNLDDGYFDLSLGDFHFYFYVTPVTNIRISTNGYITFGTDGTAFSNVPIPNVNSPNAIIAPFWDDLDLTWLGGDRGVWWGIFGTAPNRQLVIEWYRVPSNDFRTETYSFEVILYESTDRIKFQYLDVDSGTNHDLGASATVGIENFDGTEGIQYSFNGSTMLSNKLAIEFIPRHEIETADYDGDGATDVSAFHLPSDQFFTDYAANLGQFGWGGSDSMPLIWDYDGDGKTDVSIYHIPTNQWFVKGVGNLGQFGWGGEDSIPVPGDYNGDGRMERAFYHSPTNRWFVEGQDPVQFGWNGAECIPVPGDYDGDGKTDMVIYHIPSNQWFQYGVGNLGQFGWGGADSIPVPGDYNGDGKTEIAVYHIPTNQWLVKGIGNLGQYGWGGLESFPIPGDYNGDGVMERGFYRPSENRWFIEGETDFVWGWGGSDFMPITSQIAVYNWFRFMLGRFQ